MTGLAGPTAADTAAADAGSTAPDQGEPLPPALRAELAAHLGSSFERVRIHRSPRAEAVTRAHGAVALADGHDLYFGAGAYDPLTRAGRAVIAHEATHVAQAQSRATRGLDQHVPDQHATAVPSASRYADRAGESQAHDAAARFAAGRRMPGGWTPSPAPKPFLGRLTKPKLADDVREVDAYSPSDTSITHSAYDKTTHTLDVQLTRLIVPVGKGPWLKLYQDTAKADKLYSSYKRNGSDVSSELRTSRESTDVQKIWLRRVGWLGADIPAMQNWVDAGGTAPDATTNAELQGKDYTTTKFSPRLGDKTADMDHIVELQAGGTNEPDNLVPAPPSDNRSSGSVLSKWLKALALAVRKTYESAPKNPLHIAHLNLWFAGADQPGLDDQKQPAPLQKAEGTAAQRKKVRAARRGTATSFLQVHLTATADGPAGAELPLGPEDLEDYPVFTAKKTHSATLKVPKNPAQLVRLSGSSVPDNVAASTSFLPGITLISLSRPKGKQHQLNTELNTTASKDPKALTLPFTINKDTDRELRLSVEDHGKEIGRVDVIGHKKSMAIDFRGLSPGTFTLRVDGNGSIGGTGVITPSVPLLNRTRLNLDWDDAGVRLGLDAPTDKLSLPPFRVTKAGLHAELAPELKLGGEFNFVLGGFAKGSATATFDADGFAAHGALDVTIPGLDATRATLDYRPATGLTGRFDAKASSGSGLFRSGSVAVVFDAQGWHAYGKLEAVLPGGSPATIEARTTKNGDLEFIGHATIAVPGLRPVDFYVVTDGKRVEGEGHTTFSLLGAHGDLTVRYFDGRVSGTGKATIKQGRFVGDLEAALDHTGDITGKGTGSFEFRPGLVGTVSVEYGKDHRLKTAGELRFPPYTFLRPDKATVNILTLGPWHFPILGISVSRWSFGVYASVSAGLDFDYSYGPGVLHDVVIRGELYPLEEAKDVSVEASARLSIPASAALKVWIKGGLGADVFAASLEGDITITAGAGVVGGLEAAANLKYAKGVLLFDALAIISGVPVLTVSVDGSVTGQIRILGSKTWSLNLASFSYPVESLALGIGIGYHYDSEHGLHLPSADDVKWMKKPDIDAKELALDTGKRIVDAVF